MNVCFAGPAPHSLVPRAIHLWTAGLSVDAAAYAGLWSVLSADERERASRFVFDRDRRWFTAARGLLRWLLARHLDVLPGEVEFVYAERGKPSLHPRFGGQLEFNLSHSGGLAAIALTRAQPVGVDVEQMRALDDLDCLARQCFAPGERERLAQLPSTVRPHAFFNCWTRKEAYIKALGEGLSCPLESFEVTLVPGEDARLDAIDGSREAAAGWWMHAFAPCPGFVGAVVAQGGGYVVGTGWLHAGASHAGVARTAFA